MKARTLGGSAIAVALTGALLVAMSSQPVPPEPVPIATRAIATLKIPGSADFLVADGRAVWVTNEGRVERLELGRSGPVASVALPSPCGAMVATIGVGPIGPPAGSGAVRIASGLVWITAHDTLTVWVLRAGGANG